MPLSAFIYVCMHMTCMHCSCIIDIIFIIIIIIVSIPVRNNNTWDSIMSGAGGYSLTMLPVLAHTLTES